MGNGADNLDRINCKTASGLGERAFGVYTLNTSQLAIMLLRVLTKLFSPQ